MVRIATLLAGLLIVCGVVAPPVSANPPGALTFGGLQRTYVLHVPPGLDHPAGLVISLHGAGQTGTDQAALTSFNAIADQRGFVVAYPDGIDFSWADGRGASVPDRDGVDDVGFLATLIDNLTRDYAIPPGRVFVTGMSAGAFMANRLACDRADLIAAIAPVAGTLGTGVPCNPSRPVSVMQIHGTADPVVPFDGGPMVGRGGPSDIVSASALADRWRAIDGCPAPVENANGEAHLFTASGCAGGTQVVFVRIDGSGHTWPSGSFSLPDSMVGPTSHAFNASAASGQFFASR
ncbi:esterase [Mycolicibacterium litorale]|uniref:Esterase n=1 Tax=Candidatus Mycolicibacterium alkanivorans TaxID=2954114 RepID=A0ABS9YZL9_9MYCO|nr:PHB depolymerase family esterase [Candidatus Mycolicibacterium alkanivorans]MCI4676707.1 esterase [Candidatus Mycolicibacterium alkanivorans]